MKMFGEKSHKHTDQAPLNTESLMTVGCLAIIQDFPAFLFPTFPSLFHDVQSSFRLPILPCLLLHVVNWHHNSLKQSEENLLVFLEHIYQLTYISAPFMVISVPFIFLTSANPGFSEL